MMPPVDDEELEVTMGDNLQLESVKQNFIAKFGAASAGDMIRGKNADGNSYEQLFIKGYFKPERKGQLPDIVYIAHIIHHKEYDSEDNEVFSRDFLIGLKYRPTCDKCIARIEPSLEKLKSTEVFRQSDDNVYVYVDNDIVAHFDPAGNSASKAPLGKSYSSSGNSHTAKVVESSAVALVTGALSWLKNLVLPSSRCPMNGGPCFCPKPYSYYVANYAAPMLTVFFVYYRFMRQPFFHR